MSAAMRILDELGKKYENDADALDEISRARETVIYYEEKGEKEKAINHAKGLGDFLREWY